MKTIILLLTIALMFVNCNGCNKKNTQVRNDAVEIIQHEEDSDTCLNKLRTLILGCANPNIDDIGFNKSKIYVECENKYDEYRFSIRMYEYGSGANPTSTIGWIDLDVKNNTLTDVTIDPDNGFVLDYDKKLYEEVLSCFGFNVDMHKIAKEMEENGLLLPFNYLNYLEFEHSNYLTDIQGDDWDGKEDPRFINEDGTAKNDTISRYFGWHNLLSADDVRIILRITYEESKKEGMNYALLKTDKKQFNVYMLTENKTVKLITANNKPIDSLIVDNNQRYFDQSIDVNKRWDYNWREKTFTIFPNLEIVFYQNKFNGDQMIEHIPTAKYRIDDNGKFVKFED